SSTGLIQTIGRAARHVDGQAILYGDRITDSMRIAIDETNRRRAIQQAHNEQHSITPQTIVKPTRHMDIEETQDKKKKKRSKQSQVTPAANLQTPENLEKTIAELKKRMQKAAKQLEFEEAASLRDEIHRLQQQMMNT
ncbi:MAG: UvrB/UvrC motif-containing protein, partial [Myxococcota bacterium]